MTRLVFSGRSLAAVLVVALGAVAEAQTTLPASGAAARDASLARLERELERVALVGGGTVGVAAMHLQTGRRVSVRGTERFPMASTYKVPIAVQLFTRVDAGEVRLDEMVPLEPADLHPGSGTLSDLFDKPGVALSVRNLVELMLLISDNTATDLVLDRAGGARAVTARMRSLGIDGIDVNRPTVELIADWLGIAPLPDPATLTPARFRELSEAVSDEGREAAGRRFDADPRDTATPDGMVRLLERLWRREALGADSTELLLDIMRRCRSGEGRLKGLLPAGTVVAHKTGTIGATTNDVGIITLPDGTGEVAIAVFVKGSDRPVPERERAIAEIARSVHDYFLFRAP
jgi:beta-lactamase class A